MCSTAQCRVPPPGTDVWSGGTRRSPRRLGIGRSMDGPKQQRCAVPVSSDQEWATIPGRGRSAQPERARALENLAVLRPGQFYHFRQRTTTANYLSSFSFLFLFLRWWNIGPVRLYAHTYECLWWSYTCWWIWLECCWSGHFTGHLRLDLCAEMGGDCAKTNHRRRWTLSMATNAALRFTGWKHCFRSTRN